MKQPGFFNGVLFALVASAIGALVYTVFSTLFPDALMLRLVIAGVGLAYVVYLLRGSRERVGRVSVIAMWFVMAVAALLFAPSLLLYALLHIGAVWLIRSLYYYASVLSALADLGLCGVSLAAGVWAAAQTGSVFLSLWCFWLLQALFTRIPASLQRNATADIVTPDADRFQHAHRIAEIAVRKLSSIH